ncbi:hypothetical protein ACFSRY_04235 [Pontibacter locisalis]|uniref:SH3 domain-containing protein n=1 Tax=Pontibacter locisalis TaxID=1719035 RepID=A0ABW5IHF8_9BACT
MRKLLIPFLSVLLLSVASCRDSSHEEIEQDASEATVASETGEQAPLPADVIMVTQPLISGELYASPAFESKSITSFDTSQQIQVLDTSHNIFVRARIRKDTISMTGYIPKTILPEKN